MVDRDFAMHHGLPESQACDRCENQAEGQALVFGSPAWVLKRLDAVGIPVENRQGLEWNFESFIPVPDGAATGSQRSVFLCASCAAETELPLDSATVERGAEDAFRRLNEALSEGGDT